MRVTALGPAVADVRVAEQVEISAKYSGYLDRQNEEIQRQRRHEETRIPAAFDYTAVRGLSAEVMQKLVRSRPQTDRSGAAHIRRHARGDFATAGAFAPPCGMSGGALAIAYLGSR